MKEKRRLNIIWDKKPTDRASKAYYWPTEMQ